jgi:hypothetical protein
MFGGCLANLHINASQNAFVHVLLLPFLSTDHTMNGIILENPVVFLQIVTSTQELHVGFG